MPSPPDPGPPEGAALSGRAAPRGSPSGRATPEYRVGVASWQDQALIASGRFYPRRSMVAEERLRWYARFFDTVEVNSTYYALPSPVTTARWAERTPPGFLFHVKAYSLLTGHHPRLETLPAELAAMLPESPPLRRHGTVDRAAFPAEARDRCVELFRAGIAPLVEAGKLGYVLFQLAPWVRHGATALAALAQLPARLPGLTLAVEVRHPSWVPERTEGVLDFLAAHGLAFVSLDAPWQPYVARTTRPDWAVLRLHGRNLQGWLDQRAGREPTVAEKYDYCYGPAELAELADRVRGLATHGRRVAVTFNNNNQDFPVQNALDLKRLLGLAAPDPAALRAAWRPPKRRRGAPGADRP